jgi:uncharacterized membrane protein YuzA (DUF378 family)
MYKTDVIQSIFGAPSNFTCAYLLIILTDVWLIAMSTSIHKY